MAYHIISPAEPSESYSANSGSSSPIIWLDQSNSFSRSSSGTPRSPAIACSGSSRATCRTKSPEPSSAASCGDALRPLAEVGAQPLDGTRREPAGDDLAHPAVFGVVHHDHRRAARLDLAAASGHLVARHDRLLRRREHVAAQRHLADIAVLGHHPVAAVAEPADVQRLFVPPDRRRAAQLGELLHRQAGGVDVGIGEVEAGRQVRSGHQGPPRERFRTRHGTPLTT